MYALFTTCTDLTVIIVVFLKAFKTLVREIIEKNRRESRIAMNDLMPIVMDTDVKTTEVHAIHQYYIHHMHRDSVKDEKFVSGLRPSSHYSPIYTMQSINPD